MNKRDEVCNLIKKIFNYDYITYYEDNLYTHFTVNHLRCKYTISIDNRTIKNLSSIRIVGLFSQKYLNSIAENFELFGGVI